MPRRPKNSTLADTNTAPEKKRNAQLTRERLIAAAQVCFTHNSFEHVGIRDIAEKAGVNSTLIARYFGSKQGLFEEAICTQFGFPEELVANTPAEFGRALAEWALAPHPETEFKLLLALIHSAPSAVAGPLLVKYFDKRVVEPMAKHIGGEKALLRSGMIHALTLGMSVMHDVMQSKSLTKANYNAMIDLFTKLFETCLTTDFGSKKSANR
ncbi:MAG: TetR family transcriptional regulator [Spongiibacteraceae bacterium]